MNLIEQLGGYECAKAEYDDPMYEDGELYTIKATGARFFKHNLADELLEYRRQHNIYEIDDYVVYQGDSGLSGLFRIEKLTKTGKPKSVKSNRFGGFPCRYCEVRHATDEEIKAGRRL